MILLSARRRRWLGGFARLIVPVALLVSSLVPAAATQAASPSPTIVGSGDPRSEGEGAGLVGDPLLVALGVVALGVGASALTVVAVRLRRGD